MRFWAIEIRPGGLPVDEAVAAEAVRRILGITTVEALFLFTSRVALGGFLEGFLGDGDAYDGVPPSRQALKAGLRTRAGDDGGDHRGRGWSRYPDFDPRSLVGIMEGVSSYVRYVALDPDTSCQQVWSVERFGATWRNSRAALEASAHPHIHLSASERGGR